MLAGPHALACSIPVFRYALERWQPDAYHLLVYHRSALSETEKAAADRLAVAADQAGRSGPVNVVVRTVDLDADPAPSDANLYKLADSPQLPAAVLAYPAGTRTAKIAWTGRLDDAALASLFDSPVRQQIADRLTAGDSAVWVLLESGDLLKDDAAHKTLTEQLAQQEQKLKLPIEDIVADEQFQPDVKVALKLKFSVIRLSRDDPAEAMLVHMLMSSEEDLSEFSAEPMAFPVFGRGRALYALLGAGINEQVIAKACQFLVGPCSCEVKDENPGVDLLMAYDWNEKVVGSVVSDKPLPELTGLSALALDGDEPPAQPVTSDNIESAPPVAVASTDPTATLSQSTAVTVSSGTTPAAAASSIARSVVVAAAVLVALVVVASVYLLLGRAAR